MAKQNKNTDSRRQLYGMMWRHSKIDRPSRPIGVFDFSGPRCKKIECLVSTLLKEAGPHDSLLKEGIQ
jgi:hypothetical protein